MPRAAAAAALLAAAATAGLLALSGAGRSRAAETRPDLPSAEPAAAAALRETPSENDDGRERLRAPAPPSEVPALERGRAPEGFVATAYHFKAPVYERAREGSEIVGWVRRGRRLPAEARRGSCRGGSWYGVPGGFVCTGDGFHVGR
ncbi:MAG: hypothetical protein AAF447_05880, partial [Myxococcota bacterium]